MRIEHVKKPVSLERILEKIPEKAYINNVYALLRNTLRKIDPENKNADILTKNVPWVQLVDFVSPRWATVYYLSDK